MQYQHPDPVSLLHTSVLACFMQHIQIRTVNQVPAITQSVKEREGKDKKGFHDLRQTRRQIAEGECRRHGWAERNIKKKGDLTMQEKQQTIRYRHKKYHYPQHRVIARSISTGRFTNHEIAHIAFAVFGQKCGMKLETY